MDSNWPSCRFPPPDSRPAQALTASMRAQISGSSCAVGFLTSTIQIRTTDLDRENAQWAGLGVYTKRLQSSRNPNRVFSASRAKKVACSSLCAHEVDVRFGRLILRRHISPVLGVMIGIDDREYGLVHMSVRIATGDVEKVEYHRVAIRRQLANLSLIHI